jgi:3-methylcrotonyl-CoA carboxylase alpha subunit
MPAERPIRKILIANRGEIALRVMRAAHSLGIAVAAVYAESEADSYWVGRFLEKYPLGHGKVADTYLNADKIITLAKEAGADAIHPGYGFLSENHLFARLCTQNGLIFIGPPASVLEKLGDKLAASDLARDLGIPVLPTIKGTPGELIRDATHFEYPLLAKATAGGGGKGIRLVNSASELKTILELAAREAKQYFGDARIYLEKYLDAPRHVEIQIMADHHGDVVHLFERECSIQRRHQKVIEEAPACHLPAQLLDSLREAALTIARATGYVNAGTIEFLVDENRFYFLEVNARIQVEHGVTELITGLDLVQEQIRVAEGHRLSFCQEDIRIAGHAIEARLYAEDPWGDHLPSPGKVSFMHIPEATGLRVETALVSGSVVDPDYDPMIAKVMIHAPDRIDAINRLLTVLGEISITGILHNLPLIQGILGNPEYMEYPIDTGFLKRLSPEIEREYHIHRRAFPERAVVTAATLFVLQDYTSSSPSGYWRNVPRLTLLMDDRETDIFYRITGHRLTDMTLGNESFTVEIPSVSGSEISFSIGGNPYCFHVAPDGHAGFMLSTNGFTFRIARPDLASALLRLQKRHDHDDQHGFIRAPLPGRVSRIHARQNDWVEKGDSLLTIESMKLENAILASMSGVVDQIFTQEGSQVNIHDPLVILKAVES